MLSVTILTKNQEHNISDCIKSVLFADEILVIDDYSSDQTAAIAQKNGARVIKHHLNDFADQRNFALSQAKGNWIFFLDADERIPIGLQKEIIKVVQ